MILESARNIKVLLVEDNQADADYVCSLLDGCAGRSFQCECVSTLSDACRRLLAGDINVVLLDLELPDARGSQGLLELRELAPDVPIVVLTGLDDEQMAAQSVRAGAQDYLTKSAVDRLVLSRTMRYAIERKQAEAERRKSEKRFRAVFEHSPIGILLAELTAEFKILKANKAICALLGFREDELTGTCLLDLLHPADREDCRESAYRILEGGDNLTRVEKRFLTRDKQIIWTESTPSVIADEGMGQSRLLVMVEDITERKRRQQENARLQAERDQLLERLQLQMDSMPIGCLLSDESFSFTYWNPSAESIFGYKAAQVIGRHPGDLICPESYRPCLDKSFARLLGGESSVSDVMTNITGDGRTITCEWQHTRLATADGKFVGIMSMVQDISERLQAEALSRQLFAARQRDDFMATLAHDLKTPLVGANMVLGALLDGTLGTLQSAQTDMIAKLKTSNQGLLKRIQNLLEVYGYESGKLALHLGIVDFTALVREAVEDVASMAAAKSIEIRTSVPERLDYPRADGQALCRVLINLLHNAIKFTPEGGLVNISAERQNSLLVIKVQDTGQGLTESDKEKLFQRFFQGDPGRSYSTGIGLGLYFCNCIIEAHNGKITCESQPGQGTVFTIILPDSI